MRSVSNLIVRAQADGWIDRLVAGAQRDRPNNPELAALAAPRPLRSNPARPRRGDPSPGRSAFPEPPGAALGPPGATQDGWLAGPSCERSPGQRQVLLPGAGPVSRCGPQLPSGVGGIHAEVWPGYARQTWRAPSGARWGRIPGSMPTVQGSPGRWVHQLGDWLTAEAAREDGRWWFVLNGADQTDLPRETHDLIQYLAHQVAAAAFSLRLVLLGYEEPLPLGIEERVLRDNIGPIGQADLWALFRASLRARGAGICARSRRGCGGVRSCKPFQSRTPNDLYCCPVP